ncbi:MAG TPA: GNAT family N-acetyltransferase, partial [Arachnia sp.]|nr:GNAT family N-acetyltransferase [Arachnia sp.]
WRDLHDYLSQPEVVEYEPYDVYSEDQAREESVGRAADPAFWAIEVRSEAKVVGNVWLGEGGQDTHELGYVFNARYWGNGFAAEACQALIEWAFAQGTHRIVAKCNPLNQPSWRLLERLGFRREGAWSRTSTSAETTTGIRCGRTPTSTRCWPASGICLPTVSAATEGAHG